VNRSANGVCGTGPPYNWFQIQTTKTATSAARTIQPMRQACRIRRRRSVDTDTYSVVLADASNDPRQFHHPALMAAAVTSVSGHIAPRSI